MTFTDATVNPDRVYSYRVEVGGIGASLMTPALRMPGAAQNGGTDLGPGESLYVGGRLTATNRQYYLVMQTDGKLVLYRTSDGEAVWASNTAGRTAYRATMQADGNFVIYRAQGLSSVDAIWASRSVGSGRRLTVQDNELVAIINPGDAQTWNSKQGFLEQQPPTPPRAGVAGIALQRVSENDIYHFRADVTTGLVPPAGAIVDRIENTTVGTGAPPGTVYLWLTRDGYTGSVNLGFAGSNAAFTDTFRGQPAAGSWNGLVSGTFIQTTNPIASMNIYWHLP